MERSIDILGFTESNTSWDLLPELQQPMQRTRGWWETCHWSLSHNHMESNRKENNTNTYQPGGTSILCINQVAHRTQQPGDDPTGLGRWCWTCIQGPNNFFLQRITMYRPCVLSGPLTTYQQHMRGLAKLNQFECPKKAILLDITQEIQSWQDLGNHIVLLTDFNDDINEPWVTHWVAILGLVEAIMSLHSDKAPQTFQRGSYPIDGIFIAPQLLQKLAGGYLSFGDAIPSDHCTIWLDLDLPEICSMHQELHTRPQAR